MVGGVPGPLVVYRGSLAGERCLTRPPTTHQASPLAGRVMGGGAQMLILLSEIFFIAQINTEASISIRKGD